MAGLAAAWTLRSTPAAVVVFEKSRGLSGRAATRRRRGAAYDHGAQYFKTSDAETRALVHDRLPNDALVGIAPPVWIFDREGRIEPGDENRDAGGRWTYRDGISRLGKHLAAAGSAEVVRETRVGRIVHTGRRWRLDDEQGETLGTFDAVLVTAPAPQAFQLVEAGAMPYAEYDAVCEALRQGRYRAILSLIFSYPRPLPRPGAFYALVNTDKAHPISWLAFEEDKPGHAPGGEGLLIAQMATAWTVPRFRASLDDLVVDALPLVSDLLGTDCTGYTWADKQGWRYALPDRPVEAEALRPAEDLGLFFAGDSFGEGRVHHALVSGRRVGARLADWVAARG